MWDKTFGGGDDDVINGLSIDNFNNLYLSGCFYETINFGGGDRICNYVEACSFTAKLDDVCNYRWDYYPSYTKEDNVTSYSSYAGNSIKNDVLYNTYTIFSTNIVNIDFGGGRRDRMKYAIVKLDADGKYMWDRYYKSEDNQYSAHIRKLIIDNMNNCYFTGDIAYGVDFGGNKYDKYDALSLFIVKLDNNGNYLWDYSIVSDCAIHMMGTTIDNNNNIYITGFYRGQIEFEDTNTNTMNMDNIFVIKIDTNGKYVWNYVVSAYNNFFVNDITVDNESNSYIVGTYSNYRNIDLGGGFKKESEGKDISDTNPAMFVVKLDNNGNYVWDYYIYNENDYSTGITPTSIDIDSKNNIYIGGEIKGLYWDFGGGERFSEGDDGYRIFVTKLNPEGKYVWDYVAGDGSDIAFVNDMVVNSMDNIVVAGGFSYRSIDFGGGVRKNRGCHNDIFLLKIGENDEKINVNY